MLELIKNEFLTEKIRLDILDKYSLNLLFRNDEKKVEYRSNNNDYFDLIFDFKPEIESYYTKNLSIDDLIHRGKCVISGNQRFWKMLNSKESLELKNIELELRLLFKKDIPSRVIQLIKMLSGQEKIKYQKGQLCSATIPDFKVLPYEINSDFSFNKFVDDYYEDIKEEAKLLINNQVKTTPYKMYGPAWSRLAIFRNGHFEEEHLSQLPKTYQFAKECEKLGRLISFDLLLMEPGKKLYYHSDGFAFFDNWQLGVIVPEDCGLEVIGERIIHEENKSFLFNDSFNHYAWNNSNDRRVIISAWAVHREWNEEEVTALKFLAKIMKWGS